MNALVGVRNNRVGQLSPTPEVRTQVRQKLDTTAAARAGFVERQVKPALSSQAAVPVSSALQTASVQNTSAAQSTSSANGTSNATNRVVNDDTLNKDSFLQLLVLQMQNQDPLSPMDNADMLAQLAQFSSLEAQTNLNKSFEQISGNIDQLNFISASQMLGKYVEGVDINGELRTGIVEGVHLDGSLVVLQVDGVFMSMAGVIRVENVPPDPETGGGGGGGDTGIVDPEMFPNQGEQ